MARVCWDCGAEVIGDEHCVLHPDEPLADASDANVRDELRKVDSHAREKVYRRWELPFCVGGMALGTLIYFVIFGSLDYFSGEVFLVAAGGGGAVGFSAGRAIAASRFKPKFAAFY